MELHIPKLREGSYFPSLFWGEWLRTKGTKSLLTFPCSPRALMASSMKAVRLALCPPVPSRETRQVPEDRGGRQYATSPFLTSVALRSLRRIL